jgi:hypothetical protein
MEPQLLNMEYNNLTREEFIYWFCALVGSGLFFIQLILSFIGFDNDSVEDLTETNTTSFNWLSKQALASFMMMFGYVALACKKEFLQAAPISITGGLLAGALTVVITGFLFKWVRKLHSSGTVFNLDSAIGKEALVYQRIPKEGVGKISLSLNNFTHEIDAVSADREEIASFTPVLIIKKADDRLVVVKNR